MFFCLYAGFVPDNIDENKKLKRDEVVKHGETYWCRISSINNISLAWNLADHPSQYFYEGLAQ